MRWINSRNSAPAFGNYSHATEHGNLVFVSAQLPALPDGTHEPDAPAEVQVNRVMDNLEAVLAAAGSSVSRLLKLNVYITRMETRPIFETVFAGRYDTRPARTMLVVEKLNHGYLVSVDAVAVSD